jgi:urea transport system ATP-binding protein
VPQGREIFPQLSVQENLILGLEARRGRPAKSNCAKATATKCPILYLICSRVLGKMLTRKGGALSGGQQQQLRLAALWPRNQIAAT